MDTAALAAVRLGNPEVIAMLEQALGEAREGRVAGVAMVLVAGPSISVKTAGDGAQALSVGCAQLHRMLLDNVFQPRRGPGLLVPAGGGGRG